MSWVHHQMPGITDRRMTMNKTLNEILQDLADLGYTALDLKEEITMGQPSISDCVEKINKIHQVLIFNQDKLKELTSGERIMQDTEQPSINFIFTHKGKEFEIVLGSSGEDHSIRDKDETHMTIIRCEPDDNNNITWEYGEAVFESIINLNEGEE